MDNLWLWLVIGGVIWWLLTTNKRESQSSRGTRHTQQRNSRSSIPSARRPSNVYRPSSNTPPSGKISFKTSAKVVGGAARAESLLDITGLHDAFTGAPLDRSLGLHQCLNCQVLYHEESVTVLKAHNQSRCVSCQSSRIKSLASQKDATGRDYTPKTITLKTFARHVGQVITFEGYVHKVLTSRSGKSYAAMFEDKSWTRGFKLVFFSVGQKNARSEFIKTLDKKTVRVRGLLEKDRIFGYQIIVSDQSMILEIR